MKNSRAVSLLLVCLLVAGGLSFFVDIPTALFFDSRPPAKEIRRIFDLAEIGGHGTGAAMILIGVLASTNFTWSRAQDRVRAIRLIAGTYLGGLIVDGFKLLVPRVRPGKAILENANNALDTFGHHLLNAGDHSRSALMSFPSGHAAVAAGLAASLWWYLPASRPGFVTLAVLASLQRVESSNHYLSDIFIGSAIGIIGALLCAPKLPRP